MYPAGFVFSFGDRDSEHGQADRLLEWVSGQDWENLHRLRPDGLIRKDDPNTAGKMEDQVKKNK